MRSFSRSLSLCVQGEGGQCSLHQVCRLQLGPSFLFGLISMYDLGCELRVWLVGYSPQTRLVFKAHRLLYHSTLGLRVIKKKRRSPQTTQKATRYVFPGYLGVTRPISIRIEEKDTIPVQTCCM